MHRRREKDFGKDENGVDVRKGLDGYVEWVKESLNPEAVILYGSRARGDWKPWSDVDVIVISSRLQGTFFDRWDALMDYEVEIPIQPKGFTPHEFLRMIAECSMTALDAVHEGVVLYDTGFVKDARRRFREVTRKYRLRKLKDGWRALHFKPKP